MDSYSPGPSSRGWGGVGGDEKGPRGVVRRVKAYFHLAPATAAWPGIGLAAFVCNDISKFVTFFVAMQHFEKTVTSAIVMKLLA